MYPLLLYPKISLKEVFPSFNKKPLLEQQELDLCCDNKVPMIVLLQEVIVT